MVGALVSFCLMAIAAKELSGAVSTFQVLFIRSAISLLIVVVIIVLSGNRHWMNTKRFGWHGLRNISHLAGQFGWFIAIGMLPLAEVFALEFTVPFWTALLAFLFLKESISLRKLFAIVFGFVGVMVIVQPGFKQMDSGVLVILLAAICYSFAYISTRALAVTEAPITILFYMCVIQFPITLIFALFDWQTPQGMQWLWLLIIGITALTAHYCLSHAMKYADAAVVVTMDFLRLPAIAVVGALFYAEKIELTLFLGALLMLFGNVVNLYQPKRERIKQRIGNS
ncbi:DMT family transporter [Vibrio sp. 404]|uniref:DMT family transporter n=1 Tax=Vibrio marinisediminis TaxID=2758441 RepID=A0A7W2FT41_9VIBR|nr:DMT family transporter [Vibrio marinisediminis]MBA5763788.1 DMT family transporter [Vibrio marinisediminis]